MKPTAYFPEKAVFEATLACNLRCRHCGSSAGRARDDELSTDECRALFAELGELGCRWLTISGGEPMARPDWIELIAAARAGGMRVGMITNAVALDRPAAMEAKAAGLGGVGFSIDGLERTHDKVRGRIGHFRTLESAMEHCRSAGLPFCVVTTLNNDNLAELEDLYTYLTQVGCYAWQVQLGSDMGNMRKHPSLLVRPEALPDIERRLAAMIRRNRLRIYPGDSLGFFGPHEHILRTCTGSACFGGCAAGLRNVGIESNGNVKGCLSIMPGYNEEGSDWVEGNIRERSLTAIWNDPNAFAYNRRWTREQLSGFCKECGFADRCRGGCTGKRISDGTPTENRYCVYRVLVDERRVARHSRTAAAVILAGVLGSGLAACSEVDDPTPKDTAASTDSSTDSGGTSGDTAAPDSATGGQDTTPVALYAVPEYGIEPDTGLDTGADTAQDTGGIDTAVDEYGIMPDSNVVRYAMPDTMVELYGVPIDTGDQDTATPATDAQASDSVPVLLYAIAAPPEESTN